MSSNISRPIIDKIFSHEVFNGLDRDSLVKRYDVTGVLREIKAPLRCQQGQVQPTGNVITYIPPEGLIIERPGIYTFGADIAWSPRSAACTAITIASSDVVLDLNSFTLKATVIDNSRHIAGIFIRNASSVIIRNGALANICLYGICAEDCSKLIVEKITVSGLSFDNLNIRNVCPAGIHVDHADDVIVADCSVQYLYVTCDSSAGIQLTNTSKAVISDCRVGNLINYDGSVQGYSYIGSWDISTINCTATDFQSHFKSNIQTLGHTVLGFVPIFCSELKYENCSATNMIGCCDDCHGMSVFLDAGVTVTGFRANKVIDGVACSNSGAKATGLEVYGAFVSISDCTVDDIKAINPQDKQSTGFSAWGAAIKFTRCTANNVAVCDEHGKWSAALGYGTGFGWAPDPRAEFRNVGANFVEYTDCNAGNCQVGFDTWFHIDSTWTDPHTTDCGIDILVEPGASRTLSGNPCSECNPPITATITNITSGNTYPPL
jgi:hypothetical protein